MKKLLLFSALAVFLIIVVVVVIILGQFGGLSKTDQTELTQVEAYAAEKYPDYICKYDAENHTLTLIKSTDFSLASAGAIYSDDETYRSMLRIIAADLIAAANDPDLTVILRYDSKDGEPMYQVSSDGTSKIYTSEGG